MGPTACTESQCLYKGALYLFSYWLCGPGSVVGIATGYRWDGPGIESRWGARFSAPVQTGPGAHPASCTMGTRSFLGVKSSQGMTLTPHPLLVPWSRRVRDIPLLPLWALQSVQSLSAWTTVHFTFFHIDFTVYMTFCILTRLMLPCNDMNVK